MRLTTLLMLAACLQVSARSSGQTVTLSGKHLPMEQVFRDIRQQTGYSFFYQDELLKQAATVDIDVKDMPLKQVLDSCFRGQALSYTIIDKAIFVRKKEPAPPPQPAPPPLPPMDVQGRVVDSLGKPIVGATVFARSAKRMTATDENGEFQLKGIDGADTIEVSYVGYETRVQRLEGRAFLMFHLAAKINELGEIEVAVNTGYQTLNLGRATGSYDKIDNDLFNRDVSSDVISRLNGITSGLLTTPVGTNNTSGNQLGINIRGLSTINSNTQPLIVIDNFPYDGDLNNINPNDVESITVLKDAAATSIWGVRAGNGVIVITTKKGSYGQAPRVSFNANVTTTEKPNLFYNPSMSSSDYIDMETYLYNQGFYNSRVDDNYFWTALDPVQDLLTQEANGQITAADATAQINALRKYDIRNDASKYLYQKNVNQQYALNVSGGSANDQYFISGGFDNNDGYNQFLKGDTYRRVTLNANNTIGFLNHRLELSTEVYYINSTAVNNGNGNVTMPFPYPYAQLADANGNPLPIAQYRQGFLDTAGAGLLLDWNYRPLDELKYNNNVTSENEYRINLGLRYRLPMHLTADVKYQYGSMSSNNQVLNELQSYAARNLINSFSQIDWATGTVTYPVPLGDILSVSQSTFTFQNFRGQLSYSDKWSAKHQLSALAGTEIRDAETTGQSFTYYGYNPNRGTSVPVDYVTGFTQYIGGYPSTIGSGQGITGTTSRYLSYFGNADYTYKDRYTLSASGRNDGANVFGVSTNNQWKPLWSAGASWEASKEAFYHIPWLPYLRFRTTYGYQGNVTPASALLTIQNAGHNAYGVPTSVIRNPPNPDLGWEKTGQWNVGFDFASKMDRLSGSLEYYRKKGTDLLGPEILAPQTGIGYTGSANFRGNASSMKGRGIDLVLNSRNLTGRFQWTTQFLFNYNTDRVTKYNFPIYNNSSLISSAGFTANVTQVGHPVQSLSSYRWAGLDSAGNPQGYLGGKVSEDYNSIEYSVDPTSVKYDGPMAPQFFGGMRNTFGFRQVSLSFNITYKLDYFFRRVSVNYYSLFNSGYTYGTGDYAKRWQKQGDEKVTNVPSMIYPENSSSRDLFYDGSEVLVDRGDHIRLQDIQLSYDLTRKQIPRLPVSGIRIYLYANNIGILWRANHDHIDPDAIPSNGGYQVFPNPRSLAAGVKIDL